MRYLLLALLYSLSSCAMDRSANTLYWQNQGLPSTESLRGIPEDERALIEHLDLRGNRLTSVNISELRQLFPHIKIIDLSDNPLEAIDGTAIDLEVLGKAAQAQRDIMNSENLGDRKDYFEKAQKGVVPLHRIMLTQVEQDVVNAFKKNEAKVLSDHLDFGGNNWISSSLGILFSDPAEPCEKLRDLSYIES